MRPFSQAIAYISGPAVLGLAIGVIILIINGQISGKPVFTLPAFSLTKQAPQSNQTTAPASYADAVNRAAPSVVNIYTLKAQPSNFTGNNNADANNSRIMPSTGSGVIINKAGYIITNFHVIKSHLGIRVVLQDGRETEPRIIGYSARDDMAVLKIDLDNLQPINLGNPSEARIGDVVLAIGNPFGVGQTVTQGIISGTRRKGLNLAYYENFIQTDAAINPGNSGGALVDAEGRLLGINIGNLRQTGIGEANGIGFAIPADRAVQNLIDILEHGRVVRGSLGVSALDINQNVVRQFGLTRTDGVLLMSINENGPADLAGLMVGDIVTAINGTAVTTMDGAIQELANARPGDVLEIDIVRKHELLQLKAVLSASTE